MPRETHREQSPELLARQARRFHFSGSCREIFDVYADALNPPDFHAVIEVYLQSPDGGAWFMLDPTHMASVDAVARIAAGRDAADVPFAWTLGDCDATVPQVNITAPDRRSTARTAQAVVGV